VCPSGFVNVFLSKFFRFFRVSFGYFSGLFRILSFFEFSWVSGVFLFLSSFLSGFFQVTIFSGFGCTHG
jgi:hypothetical protein